MNTDVFLHYHQNMVALQRMVDFERIVSSGI
jgi:hypothetical protein